MSRKKINKPKSPFKVRVENDGIYISALKQDNAQLTQLNYDLMKRYKVKTSDPVTNDVIDRIFVRHQQGMKRFKQTMDENPKTIDDWTEDIIEELIDAICYLVVLKKRLHKVDCLAQIEEVKKEADTLMINKMKKHYEETESLKKETELVREQAQIDILTKDRDLNAKDKELGRLYKKINELESRNGKETKVGR